ncbi:Heme-copper oxidase subunit III family profile domain-containing protein [Bordetella sputigena]|uniref:cytochrome c oxidase subunit 3 n=1 Tax=Bordetella sputigena TaxID=1416810 RepID=UPI0039EF1C4C
MNEVTLDGPDTLRAYQARLGMWIFLATELMFFGPVFLGYAVGRLHMPGAFTSAARHTDVLLGALNTVVLLSSSAAIALATECQRAGVTRLARRFLWITAALGAVFLAVKGYEYAKDLREGLWPGASFHAADMPDPAGGRLFFFLYFFATGLHAVHLTIGIFLVLIVSRQSGRVAAATVLRRQETVGLYWHFVDVVWVFLFPILYLAGRAP